MRTPPLVLTMLLLLAGAAHAAAVSDGNLVQAPSLARPERGSVAGSMAQLAFGPADLSRGAFQLPSPMSAPQDRGPLLAQVFPAYSPDAGQSEWGLGWQADLSIRRFRELGELDYATDGFTSPWGKLVRGDDGYYYPQALTKVVRVAFDPAGAGSFSALEPNGTVWSFRAADATTTPRGTYAWQLSEVTTVLGDHNELVWVRNPSGRPFLSKVRWGGRTSVRQYELEIVYADLWTPFDDYRSGAISTLDRRVSEVRLSERHAQTGVMTPRWTWKLAYSDGLTGPAFYLSDVQRVFASGEAEPAVHYDYDLASLLGDGAFLPLPELDPFLAAYGTNAIDSDHSAFVDLDDDGTPEIEHAASMTTWAHGASGWSEHDLPAPTGHEEHLCRRDPGLANPPRQIMRLAPGAAPFRVVAASVVSNRTRFVVCDTAGVEQGETSLEGMYAPGALTRLSDLDHDLRPDLVRLNPGSVDVAMSTGEGDALAFAPMQRQTLTPRFTAQAAWIEDVNGDGVADLVGRATNVIVVWPGLGHGSFVPDGLRFSVVGLDGRRITDLSGFTFTWLDANKDGLLDLALGYSHYLSLYTNDGLAFRQRDVAALHNLGFDVGVPLAVDLSGRGESEIVVVRDRHAQALALTTPSNGLLVRSDDGKGNQASFTWERAPAAPGLPQRPAVLAELTVSTVGQPPATYSYDYETPRTHSLARYLIGFAHTRRVGPVLVDDTDFHHDDEVAGVVLGSTSVDSRTPDVLRFDAQGFEERRFHGVRWWRPTVATHGWRHLDGSGAITGTSRVLTYEREICPVATLETTRHGVLYTEHTLAHASRLPDDLHCLEATEHRHGTHADSSLDFDYRATVSRDDVGAQTEIRSNGDGSNLLLQQIGYDGEHRVATVTAGDGTVTRATWEPGTGRLVTVVGPDGVRTDATLDPVTDATLSLREDRGGGAFNESFRFDGQERLARRWDDQGGATELAPIETLGYRYARGALPAAVHVFTRLSSTSRRESVELSTAAGTALTTATHVAEGWSYDTVAMPDPAHLERSSFVRDLSGDPLALAAAQLHDGGNPVTLAREQTSGFGDPVFAEQVIQHGVVGLRQTTRRLVGDEIVLSTVENGTLTTLVGLDEDGKPLWRTDAAGNTTRLGYDALGRLVAVTLPGGDVHERRFDAHGRDAYIRRAGVGRVRYAYDATTGQPTQKLFYDADDRLVRASGLAYDAAGRVKSETFLDAAGHLSSTTREWDTGAGQLGRQVAVSGPGYEKHMRFRPDGLPLSMTTVLTGWRTVEESFSYYDNRTAASHHLRVLDAAGHELTTLDEEDTYDALGRQTAARYGGVDVERMSYDANGRLAAIELPDGQRLVFSRDADTRRVNGYTQKATGFTSSMAFTRDARGLTDSESFGFAGMSRVRRYSHEARGFLSLVEEAGRPAQSYDYGADGRGTRLVDEDGERAITRTAGHIVAGAHEYDLDRAGRVVRRDDLALAYGPDGQLASATRAGRSWSYVHDESGRRLARIEDGRPVVAWVAGGTLDDTGFVLPISAGGHIVGAMENGRFRSLMTDDRGSLLSEGETPVLPSPFGVRAQHPRLAAALDFASSGWDEKLGVVRMGVRDYDPLLGEFLTPDPLYLEDLERVAQSPVDGTLYAYGRNNPVDVLDPSGHEGIDKSCNCSMTVGPITIVDQSPTSTMTIGPITVNGQSSGTSTTSSTSVIDGKTVSSETTVGPITVEPNDMEIGPITILPNPPAPQKGQGALVIGLGGGGEVGVNEKYSFGAYSSFVLVLDFEKNTVQFGYTGEAQVPGITKGGITGVATGLGVSFSAYKDASDVWGAGHSTGISTLYPVSGEVTSTPDDTRNTGATLSIGKSWGMAVHEMDSNTIPLGPAIPMTPPPHEPRF